MKRTLLLLPLLALAVGGAGCRDVKRALSISQEDSARILALRDRIAAGDVSAVGELGRSVNYVFDDGSTPLFVAIAACDSNVVAALVERGADVNKAFQVPRYSEFDRADVHNVDLSPMAAALANLEPRPRFGLVRFLPAPDVPEERYAKSKAIARFLLDHGADPTEALTAVAVVPEKDFDEMLALVARAGADPDKTYREPGSYSVAYVIEARFAIEKDRLRRLGASEESRKWMDELDDRLRRIRAIATNAPAASEPHAESAEPEPHAEPADSPLATALAGGEWIPLVVESVYIDATAPRELRKNWIVSFSGGIQARVHSPVKTFGESYGDLPGKRFGVRFVDRAAALAALHGTVYSGELEVRSAQGPVSAAANAAAEKEAAVRAKLDAIVFDSLEYQDANAADVISDLCERAREMDKDEPDPAKKGVSVVVGVDVKDIDEILARTTVTLKERSVSLGAALDRVADAIGLKVRVVGGCVLLGIYKGPLECRIFPVPPDLASRFLGDGNDWKARFAEIGIEWPDGTYVRYLMSVGRLTVYNTPDDLDRIERALAEAAPSPAEDDLTAAVRAKLDRIIVEKVEWQQKNIADAIADLGDFSRQFDPETDIRKRGVGFTLDLGEAPSEADPPRLTVRLHRVTLHSLLDLVADMADLEYRIEGGRVVLRRKDAESAELAASAREEDNDEKVQAFLRRIEEPGVIPELEWRDASVADVAQLLTDCSPILNPGTFEERGGVHFVTDADSEDFPKGAVPRVSCRAGEVSLLQAAHLAAEAAGWRATAYPESRAIRIGFSWSCGPVYSMADATPELVAAIERELPAAENPDESARLRSFLAARGVRWSESDEAQLRSDIGKLVFTVAEEDTARLIRAILAAPGFALRRIPVRAKVVSIEGDPTRFGLGGRDSALTIRTLSTEDLAKIAAAFDAGAEVTALEPLQAEEGLPAAWKQVSSPAPGFEALVVLTPAADGEGRRVHFVLRSFPPDADAETVAPHGCAGDAALAHGEALLVGAIPVAGAPDRSLALLLEFPDTQSPEEEKTHAENAEPKPLSLAAKLQP